VLPVLFRSVKDQRLLLDPLLPLIPELFELPFFPELPLEPDELPDLSDPLDSRFSSPYVLDPRREAFSSSNVDPGFGLDELPDMPLDLLELPEDELLSFLFRSLPIQPPAPSGQHLLHLRDLRSSASADTQKGNICANFGERDGPFFIFPRL
jgi:hypothetical protein